MKNADVLLPARSRVPRATKAPTAASLSTDDAAYLDPASIASSDAPSTYTPTETPTESKEPLERRNQNEDTSSSRFSTTTKLDSESVTILSPPSAADSNTSHHDDSIATGKHDKADFYHRPITAARQRLPVVPAKVNPNFVERLRWLFVALPLLGGFWGALPVDHFLVILQLVITVAIAYVTGCLVGLVPRIPPLLGMMAAGAALTNLDLVTIPSEVAAKLRSMALAVILLRAGIGLDLAVLRKLSAVCVRLTFIPCFAEAFMVMLVAHLLLGLPILWALLLGFVLAAVSPAVVVPAMIDLTQRRLGTNKGIPTLIMAASSFDDVAAITGFGVVLGMIFQSAEGSSLVWTLLLGPLEAVLGLAFGALLGIVIAYIFPANRSSSERLFDLLCSLYVALSGVAAIFVSNRLGFGGVGPLAAITASAAAVVVWKRQATTDQADDVIQITSCSLLLKYLWTVFEPVLFSMIGLEFRFSKLSPEVVSWGVATLLICLLFRIVVTYLAVSFSTLNQKERSFVCVAWLPKATVQAALAPTALDMVRSLTNEGNPVDPGSLVHSETVLTVGVLAIIITAPIGALAISLLAPKLLKKEKRALQMGAEEQVAPLNDPGAVESLRV